MDALASLYSEFVMPTYGRFELDIARGEGCRVWDFEGKEYLDFGAGIAVCSLGHAHPEITEAASKQASILVHTSNLYRTGPQAELARRLVGLVGRGKVFFCNSGAEANEGLIKLTRKFGNASGRYEILTFKNSFHGRTMAGISATAQEKIKKGFAPLLDGFVHLPFQDLDAVSAAIGPKTARRPGRAGARRGRNSCSQLPSSWRGCVSFVTATICFCSSMRSNVVSVARGIGVVGKA